MLVDNSHTLYIINHSILFHITIHTVTYHTNTQSLQLSCLCLLFHNILRYLIVSFSIYFLVLTQYPFIISYSSIPSFKSLIAPLHLPLSSPFNVCRRSGYSTSKGPAFITIIVIILIPTQIGPHAIVLHRAPQ